YLSTSRCVRHVGAGLVRDPDVPYVRGVLDDELSRGWAGSSTPVVENPRPIQALWDWQGRTSGGTMDPWSGSVHPFRRPWVTEFIMSDASTQELIDNLRRSVRRWKTLALTLLVGLGVVLVLGVGATVVQVQRARQEAQAAREAEMEARQRAEEAHDQAQR